MSLKCNRFDHNGAYYFDPLTVPMKLKFSVPETYLEQAKKMRKNIRKS